MSVQMAKHIIKALTDNYGKQYPKDGIAKIWNDLLAEPPKAMEAAYDYFVLNSSFLPPPAQLLARVQAEGKRIRLEAAKQNEEEWQREKGVNGRGRVEGPTFLSKQQQKEYDKRSLMLLRATIEQGPSEMIAEGCLAMANAYPHVSKEWLDLRQDIIGQINQKGEVENQPHLNAA